MSQLLVFGSVECQGWGNHLYEQIQWILHEISICILFILPAMESWFVVIAGFCKLWFSSAYSTLTDRDRGPNYCQVMVSVVMKRPRPPMGNIWPAWGSLGCLVISIWLSNSISVHKIFRMLLLHAKMLVVDHPPQFILNCYVSIYILCTKHYNWATAN